MKSRSIGLFLIAFALLVLPGCGSSGAAITEAPSAPPSIEEQEAFEEAMEKRETVGG